MNAYGMTDRGLVRTDNQDAYKITQINGLPCFVVCDGMGGHNAGNIASTYAVEKFIEALTAGLSQKKEPLSAIEAATADANEALYQAAASSPSLSGMGTTLVSAVFTKDTCYIGNIGDSRAYIISSGDISQITTDHSLVAGLVKRGEITEEEAKSHPGRNLITRALGTEASVSCDTFTMPYKKGDMFVLCSDGLTNLVTKEELLSTITGANENSCKALLKLTYKRGASDNITVLIVEA